MGQSCLLLKVLVPHDVTVDVAMVVMGLLVCNF